MPTPSTSPSKKSRPRWRVLALAGGSAIALALIVTLVLRDAPAIEEVALSEALHLIAEGDVAQARVDDGLSTVMLTLDGQEEPSVSAKFPAAYADELTQVLVDADIELKSDASAKGSWVDVLMRVLPILLILAVLIWAVKAATPSGLLGAKRRRALGAGEYPQVRFSDVAGADEAIADLSEMVKFLREPEAFAAVGATPPRGALLVGPPGTGKTLLARAVAGEAQVPFFALAGSDFVEAFVGLGARRVRDLFNEARKAERAIIFIDEIDAIGRSRSSGPAHPGASESDNTLVSLLHELDGFAGRQVLVLAATNRPEVLDAALTRPGRLDKQIQVPNPDRGGRTRILAVHAKGRPLSADVDLVQVARQTPGMSGADLAQVVNEACMEAARRGQTQVSAACFQAAVATMSMGRARTSAIVTPFDRRVTAWHEAGHALAAALLPDADAPLSVSIIPRGPAGGVTWLSGNDDVFLTRRRARARLTVALAGRAAEERVLDGECTQGASSDLEHATNLATAMVTRYAMTDFGLTHIDETTLRAGGTLTAAVYTSVEQLLQTAHADAVDLLDANSGALEAIADALLDEETLSATRLTALIEDALEPK